MIRLIYCYDHRKNGLVYALEIIDAKWFEQYFMFYLTHRIKAELSNTTEHNRLTCSILTLETISLKIQQSLVKEHPQEGDDKLFPLGNHFLCTYVLGNLGCALWRYQPSAYSSTYSMVSDGGSLVIPSFFSSSRIQKNDFWS
jgi:hypothetical protein